MVRKVAVRNDVTPKLSADDVLVDDVLVEEKLTDGTPFNVVAMNVHQSSIQLRLHR